MTKKLIGLELEKAYELRFEQGAPYYSYLAEYKSMEEWEKIMRQALKDNKPHEFDYDEDVLY